MAGRAETRVAERGDWGTVEYIIKRNGHALAKEFVDGLSESDRAKVSTLFERMAALGEIRNGQKFKQVDGAIFEFKSFQIRIGCFRVRNSWLLTHGFIKKQDKWPRAELTRATEIRTEYLADNK